MPSRRFALDRGEPKRLTVKWGRRGRDVEVLLDGLPLVPSVPGGLRFRLPDGRSLAVSVDAASGALDVIRDGEFLPGTRFDPHHQVLLAYATLFVLAAFHCALPFLPLERFLPDLHGVAWSAVPCGLAALYALAGLGTWKRRKAALGLGAALAGLEGLALSVLYAIYAETVHFQAFLLYFAPLAPILSGFDGMDALAVEEPRRV